ncbi:MULTISPECIES: hypothetical protein [Acinetobacter]|uniref:Uncharacterized protein n=1 Tax=Acinetobacter indicus TaxID=756892 RepID=A0AAW8Z7K8_9GAMM|nr:MULTISPECIES: hypothetical protein [Acinetobacter]MCO8108841.1 hypothetical protein [Acinetobacter indicus]MDM1245678.1 hypothetical protein [Acinetobacter indicus]MDM1281385.1 hypothetical protein [Acinetobacter indicus]MDM1289714.1 hypothetical protein [Acinetobacter indicus]MDO4580147.1 hypothetical protein [Acinetobacter sp.]
MFNFKIFNKVSTDVLTIKNDLELNTELQLINKYKTATSDDYRQAIVLIFKERGYSALEIGQLLIDKV